MGIGNPRETCDFTLTLPLGSKFPSAAPTCLSQFPWELEAQKWDSVRPAGSEKLGSKFRTRGRWKNPSGRGDPPPVTKWVTRTKPWESSGSRSKVWSVILYLAVSPFSVSIPGRPLGMAADLGFQLPASTPLGLPAPELPRVEDLPRLAPALRPGLQTPLTPPPPPLLA